MSNQVTVLVFKDNYAARTFQIPLGWISRLGYLLGLCALLTVGSVILASWRYHLSHKSDPSSPHTEQLEKDLIQSRTAYQNLEAQLQAAKAHPTATAPKTSSLLFEALPETIQAPPTDPKTVSIAIHSPSLTWQGKVLHVRFDIQYTLEDKNNQQGRIILLARGGSLLQGFPEGVINPYGSSSLINPEKGEFFSVSRIREVTADFGPVKSPTDFSEVEVLLLSSTGQILVHDHLTPPTAVHRKEE